MILLFEDVNYRKVKSTSKLLRASRDLLYETDNLKSILLKAALKKLDVKKDSKIQYEHIHK